MDELGIYAIFDKKGERYDTPFFAVNDLFARRRFIILIRDKETMLNVFKNDFVLDCIGQYYPVSGEIVSCNRTVIEGLQISHNGEEKTEDK